MPFRNNKKTFLAKLDKSKKGDIDKKVVSLVNLINSKENYYTTSSCSGRVYFWKGTGKKNETEWLRISHDTLDRSFFELDNKSGLVWLRLEPFIIHVACKDLDAANKLVQQAQKVYKKSSLLSISKKIIVEIKGSEHIEMPFYQDKELLFNGDLEWLLDLINEKMVSIEKNIKKFKEKINKNFF